MFSFYVKHIAFMIKMSVFIHIKVMWSFSLLTQFFIGLKLQFFYETLMRRKDNDCFCRSSDTKCWWHGLKDVKVTCSMKIDENVDLKTMTESL
jgi:hypothetical protein